MSFYSVILPTYNERENLPYVVALLDWAFEQAGARERYEVVVVDDGSPDGTAAVARRLRSFLGAERVVLAERPGKLGLGTAYRHGLERVSAACTHVVLMDADLSHHPLALPRMIACAEATAADIVTGTRYGGGHGAGVCGWNWRRKAVSSVANALAQTLLAPGASDLTGSFRLYRRPVLQQLLAVTHSRGYVFQMEVMVRATRQFGFRVAEVPIVFVDRMFYGESKLGRQDIVEYLLGLWRLFWTV